MGYRQSPADRATWLRKEIARLEVLLAQPGLAPFVITANRDQLAKYRADLMKASGDVLSRGSRPITPEMRRNYAQGVQDATAPRYTITLDDAEYHLLLGILDAFNLEYSNPGDEHDLLLRKIRQTAHFGS